MSSSGPIGSGDPLPVLPRLSLVAQDERRSCWPRHPAARGYSRVSGGKAVDAMLYHWIWTRAEKLGFSWGEAGWILEDNPAMNAGLENMIFRVDKTYRLELPPAMKVLVTGATGFVGSHLVEALCRRGIEVFGAGPLPRGRHNWKSLGVRIVAGDLDGEGDALAGAVRGAGGSSSTWPAWWRRRASRTSCAATGTTPPGWWRPRAGAGAPRFVLVSSMAAGGPAEPGRPAHRRRAAPAGHGLRSQQARGRIGGHRRHPALGDPASADGLWAARPRGAEGVPHGSTPAWRRCSGNGEPAALGRTYLPVILIIPGALVAFVAQGLTGWVARHVTRPPRNRSCRSLPHAASGRTTPSPCRCSSSNNEAPVTSSADSARLPWCANLITERSLAMGFDGIIGLGYLAVLAYAAPQIRVSDWRRGATPRACGLGCGAYECMPHACGYQRLNHRPKQPRGGSRRNRDAQGVRYREPCGGPLADEP